MVEQDDSSGIDIEYFLEDISMESSTRVVGAVMIIIGSILGVQLGILLISVDPEEIISGSVDSTEQYSDVSGIVNSALSDNNTAGDPVEGVKVRLL